MPDLLDVSKLLFLVDDEGFVHLCCGPFQVKVCDHPDDFDRLYEQLIDKLGRMKDELHEYYVD